MMKFWKRILSVMMIVVFCLTMTPISGLKEIFSYQASASSYNVCLSSLQLVDFDRYTGNLGDSFFYNLNKQILIDNDRKYYRNGNIGVDETVYENGFEVWIARWNNTSEISWATITYDIDGMYDTLSGSTGLIKSYNTNNFDTTVYFYGDDQLLHSQVLTNDNYKFDFNIDVKGVNNLKILVQDNVAAYGGTSFALYDLFLHTTKTPENTNGTMASGRCGDNLTWTLYNDGELVIYGNGEMEHYLWGHPQGEEPPWYEYRNYIKKITVDTGVSSIGSFAFRDCYNLESVELADTIKYIDIYAFASCSKLKSFSLPEMLEYICSYAFSNCDNLFFVDNILKKLSYIPEGLFEDCDNIEKIVIPDNVSSIELCAFESCDNLTNVTIPYSITYIGLQAFNVCDNINTVYYTGSEAQWNSVDIDPCNEDLINANIIFNSTGPDSTYYLTLSSTNQTNSVPVGENLKFRIKQYHNEKVTSEKKEYVVSFSDSEIFEITASTASNPHNKAHFDIQLKAKKEGTTVMTVNDPDTGAYISVVLTATKEMNVWRFNVLPNKEYQKDRLTNFYNINGLYVDDFSYSIVEDKDKQHDEKYKVSMNIYNGKSHYGAAVAYDKHGNIYDYDIIKPLKTFESSMLELGIETWFHMRDTYKHIKDSYYYTGETITQYNRISLNVPDDGHIIISNNCQENEIAYLANAIETTINAALSTSEAVVGMAGKIDTGIIVENVIDTVLEEMVEDVLINVINSSAKTLAEITSYNQINKNFSDFSAELKNKGVNILKIITDILNIELGISITEAVLLKILPTGELINAYFITNNACNAILLVDDIKDSNNAPQIGIYSPLNDDEEYVSNGVIVKPDQETDPEYVLHSFIVANDSTIHMNTDNALDAISDTRTIYNITLYKDGNETQPKTKIKIMIPIPENYDKNKLVVYWCKEDGTLEIMNSYIEGKYIVFETDHLSYYALVSIEHDETNHAPGEWEIVIEPQIGIEGKEQQKCTVCGAVVNERTIPALPNLTYMIGDVNGDGKITASDARLALRISAQIEIPTETQFVAADLTGDGKVTAADARKILRISAGLETI